MTQVHDGHLSLYSHIPRQGVSESCVKTKRMINTENLFHIVNQRPESHSRGTTHACTARHGYDQSHLSEILYIKEILSNVQ